MNLLPFEQATQVRFAPALVKLYGFSDQPDSHRWRAWWEKSNDRAVGIILHAYPVVRLTPAGAWIDPDAYRDGEWILSGNKRWVSNRGNSAWAKPNQSAAVRSLVRRYEHWALRAAYDVGYLLSCASVVQALAPEHASRALQAREIFLNSITAMAKETAE